MASSRQMSQYELPHASEYILVNNDEYPDHGVSLLPQELGSALQRAQAHAFDLIVYHIPARDALARIVTTPEQAGIIDMARVPPMDDANRRKVIGLLIKAPNVAAAELWDFCAHHKQHDPAWPIQIQVDHIRSFAFAIREYGPNSIEAARHLLLVAMFIVHEYAHWLRSHGSKGIWGQSPPCFSPRSLDFANTNECWQENEDIMAGEVGYWFEEQVIGGIMGFRQMQKLFNPEGVYTIERLLLRNVLPSRLVCQVEHSQMMASTFELSDHIVYALAGLDKEEGDFTVLQFEKYLPVALREKTAPSVPKKHIHFRRPRIYPQLWLQ